MKTNQYNKKIYIPKFWEQGRSGSDRPQADGLKFKGKFFRGESIKPN